MKLKNKFAKEGAFVVLLSRDRDRLTKTKDMIKEAEGKAEINS